MPSLFDLNLTKNFLTGRIPREIGGMSALILDKTISNLISLALPFLFHNLQYNRLFNLRRGLKVDNNNLSGSILEEIGRLRLLHVLDLNNNNFNGSLPSSFSHLTNLERLNLSRNHLRGEIPEAWTQIHFLSSFSVADNDLQGGILIGGQFETFPLVLLRATRGLCGYILKRSCGGVDEEEHHGDSWLNEMVTFGFGYSVGLVAVSITLLCKAL